MSDFRLLAVAGYHEPTPGVVTSRGIFLFALATCFWLTTLEVHGEVPDAVLAAQQARIDAIARASTATVAVFDAEGGGGGSAVLISPDGFALTNFHVVAPCGPAMKCGLSDGVLYDAVVVGIDPVGDVALIQLLGRDDFPVAEFADSDEVRVGDWCFAAGNPFLLADDFRPSISCGIVSGVGRYQYPAGTLLEYTDCLQTDAAINPGNSGGPLFDAAGRLIGVNGRGSFEKRGRVNVGVGYAISINQMVRFLGHLKSGRIVDHASLGATVSTHDGAAVVDQVLESSDAYRRGLRYDDELVQFDSRPIFTANSLKNVLGVYPPGWRVPLVVRRAGETLSLDVRLASLHGAGQLAQLVQQEVRRGSEPPPDAPPRPRRATPPPGEQEPPPSLPDQPPPRGHKRPAADSGSLPSAVAARYVARRGYANYWYNEQAQDRLWRRGIEQAGWGSLGYRWNLTGSTDRGPFSLTSAREMSEINLPAGGSGALFSGDLLDQLSPPRSGGMLLAIHLWQRFAEKGLRQFGEVSYLGELPAGAGQPPADCLLGVAEGMEMRFYFDRREGHCLGMELFTQEDDDPCEIWLADYREVGGRMLPFRWTIRHGDLQFATLEIESWEIQAGGAEGPGGEN